MTQILSYVLSISLTLSPVLGWTANQNDTVKNVLDTRVSFDVQNAEIGGVIKVLAESFDLNIVASEGLKGTVTLSLKDVRLQDALDLLLQATHYFYRLKGNVILIESAQNQLVTEVVSLNYVKASEIIGSLKTMASEQGSVATVDREDRIVIKDLPPQVSQIVKEIEKLDQLPSQILIEARIIEVEDTDLSAYGVTWASNLNLAGYFTGKRPVLARTFLPPGIASASTATVTQDFGSGDFRVSLPETSADLSGGQVVTGLTLGRGVTSATIDDLIRKNKAHLLASPSIATQDGQEAKIIIGEKFPFRENTLTAVGTTETTKFIDVGVALRVTPKVVADDSISLTIHPEVSSVSETLSAGPRISTREATTKVVVKNGQAIVIAGLIRNDKTVIRQRVPFFGDIPLIGIAFRNKSTDYVTRELAVFITPYLMRPTKGEEGETVIDRLSPAMFYNRGLRLLEEYGIEGLGKSATERSKEAADIFKSVARNYPEADQADDALYHLGWLYFDRFKNYHQAARAWNQLRIGYPDSPYVSRGLRTRLRIAERRAEREAERRRNRDF